MKIALVHDYLKEYGGAERVLQTLHEIFPEAPIYTAFMEPNSTAAKAFSDTKIIVSWANPLIRYHNLHSFLRFLIPLIWESFDFSGFDVVILSSSGYITKPIRIPKKVKVICYCHTPPRFLYGYPGMDYRNYWYARLYKTIVSHFLRIYDWHGAQRVDKFIANSKEVASRIKKFYRRDSTVIYPPVELKGTISPSNKEKYFLVVGRIVGFKGVDLAIEAAKKLGVKLKVVGEYAGIYTEQEKIKKITNEKIEFLGRVPDKELNNLYSNATAFLALAKDEDFGITPVEAMAAGRPVIAYRGGGYLETVIEGKTGVFFDEYSVEGVAKGIRDFEKIREKIKPEDCRKQAEKFSKERFKKEILEFIKKI